MSDNEASKNNDAPSALPPPTGLNETAPVEKGGTEASRTGPNMTLVWFCLGLSALVIAAVWYWHCFSWKPKNFDLIVQEITSVGDFRKAPAANNSGQHLWYARNSEHGVGMYHADMETLARRKVVAVEVVDRGGDYFNIFGWSPDDQYVLYTETADSKDASQQVTLCDGSDFSFISVFDMPDRIEEGVWVTTNSFVLLDRAQNIYLCNHRPEALLGANGQERIIKLTKLGSPDSGSLMVMDATHVAYMDRGNLYRLNLANGKPDKINHIDISKGEECKWVNYSREKGCFLFCRPEPTKNSSNLNLYKFIPKGRTSEESLTMLSNGREYVMNGRWVQNGTGYAYVSTSSSVSQISVRTRDKSLQTNLFVEGHVRAFSVSPDGEKLYAIASEESEPQSIWEYSIKDKTLRCVVPGTDEAFRYSQIITPLKDSVKSSDGRSVPYYMLPPRDFDYHKRYPVVIDGPSDSRWQPHSQLMANMGVYYVSVSRRGLGSSDDLSDGAKDMMAMYHHLVNNPNVDTNRIFIMGFSASTVLVKELAEKFPKCWRGLILNGPVAFPEIQDSNNFPAIFISMGEEDTASRLANVQKFEEALCFNTLRLHSDYPKSGGHIFSSIELIRDRNNALARFILQN